MPELEFDTWGMGDAHARRWTETHTQCPKCEGAGLVGPATFPCTCPRCGGSGSIEQEVTHG